MFCRPASISPGINGDEQRFKAFLPKSSAKNSKILFIPVYLWFKGFKCPGLKLPMVSTSEQFFKE
jgi:hypothetical protein